jgi:hypothetical protein
MGGPRRWDRWFLAVAVPFGLFLAVATPPMQELDSITHLPRVDRIAAGHLVERVDGEGRVEPRIDGCVHGFMTHHMARGLADESLDVGGNWEAVPCTESTTWGIPNSAITSPVPYLAAAAGYAVAEGFGAGVNVRYLAARLVGLAVYVGAVWAAIRVAPRGRSVLFAVAVLPSSLALAAGVAADATAIWTAILAVALVLRTRDEPSPRLLGALAVTLVVLALAKNLYGPFVLLLLLVPAAAFPGRSARLRYLGAAGAAVVAVTALWAAYASTIHYRIELLGIDSEAAARFVADHPLRFLRSAWNGLWHPFVRDVTLPGMVEVLGGLRQPRVEHIYGDLAPLWLVGLAAVVLALAILADPGPLRAPDRRGRAQVAAVTAAIAVSCTLLVFLGLALTANPPGAGILVWTQGRYFLPLLPLLALAAGRRPPRPEVVGWAVPVGSVFLLGWVAGRVLVVFY